MPRLFVAAWPPDEVRARLRDVRRDGWGDARWMPEENWHVTLAFLGEADTDGVTQALRRTTLPLATADVSPRLEVMGRTSLVLPVAGVAELARAVRTATLPDHADRRFRGHITMARSRGGRPIKGHSAEPAPWSRLPFDIDEVAVVPPCPGIGFPPDADIDPAPARHFVEAMRASAYDLALQLYGGRPMSLIEYDCGTEASHEGENIVYGPCTVRLRTQDRDTLAVRLFNQILERDGRFKFLSYGNRLD